MFIFRERIICNYTRTHAHTHTQTSPLFVSLWSATMGAGNLWHVPLPWSGTVPGVRATGDGIPHAVPRRMSTRNLWSHDAVLGMGLWKPSLVQGDLQRAERHVWHQWEWVATGVSLFTCLMPRPSHMWRESWDCFSHLMVVFMTLCSFWGVQHAWRGRIHRPPISPCIWATATALNDRFCRWFWKRLNVMWLSCDCLHIDK